MTLFARTLRRFSLNTACTAAALTGAMASSAMAQTPPAWQPERSLQGPFAVASLPDAPQVVMNASGRSITAWNSDGQVRYADAAPGGRWSATRLLAAGTTGQNAFTVALSPGGLALLAWTTVADKYHPSRLMAALRNAQGGFQAPVDLGPANQAWDLQARIACDGAVTLIYADASGIAASNRAAAPAQAAAGCAQAFDTAAAWSAPQRLSTSPQARLPSLAANARGDAIVAWQEADVANANYDPARIAAAVLKAGGGWQPAIALTSGGASPWNAKAGIDAQGRAAVGYVAGGQMWVLRQAADGRWGAGQAVSGGSRAQYPALALSEAGDLLVAWQALDAGNRGSVWQRAWPATQADWSAASRLSPAGQDAAWPHLAMAGDASMVACSWTDNRTNAAQVARRQRSGRWLRDDLGYAWWNGDITLAAGHAALAAAWGRPQVGNVNAAYIVGRQWR